MKFTHPLDKLHRALDAALRISGSARTLLEKALHRALWYLKTCPGPPLEMI